MLTAAKTMTLTPRTYQGHCQHISPPLSLLLSLSLTLTQKYLYRKKVHTQPRRERLKEKDREEVEDIILMKQRLIQ